MVKRNTLLLAFAVMAGVLLAGGREASVRALVGDQATLGYNTAKSSDTWRVTLGGEFIPGSTGVYSIGLSTQQVLNLNMSGTLNALAVVPTDTSTSRLHVPSISSTTLAAITTLVVGDQYFITPGYLSLCVATGTAQGAVVLSSAPAVQCRQN